MRKFIPILMGLLGLAEIFYAFVVKMKIYAQEVPFSLAMGFPNLSSEQLKAFQTHLSVFKHQWNALIWFGVATLVLAVLLGIATRNSQTKSATEGC